MSNLEPSRAARQALAFAAAGVLTWGVIVLALALRGHPPI